MSKPYSAQNLSDIFDVDLIWRRKELSDMKAALRSADNAAQAVHVRAIIAMAYAHWEGYVRTCANRYFEHLTLRKQPYADYERQIYVNKFLVRLDALYQARTSLAARCDLINEILDGINSRFAAINPDLVDTKSNLNTESIKEICLVCGVDPDYFEQHKTFLDAQLLKRRNAIAHGQQEFIRVDEVDDLVAKVLSLMTHFRGLLENKVYSKKYVAVPV